MSIDLFLYSGNVPKEIKAEQLNDWFVGCYTKRRHTYRELLSDITECNCYYGDVRKLVRDYLFNIWKQNKNADITLSDFNNLYFEITPTMLTDFELAITSHSFGDVSVEGALFELLERIAVEFDYGNRVFIQLSW